MICTRCSSGIDDIDIRPTFCFTNPPIASGLTTTTEPTTTTTNPEGTIQELTCHFEDDKCIWKNDEKTDYKWKEFTGLQGFQAASGPLLDHTNGNTTSRYLAITDILTASNTVSSYVSPELLGTKCVEFWYFFYGTNVRKIWGLKPLKPVNLELIFLLFSARRLFVQPTSAC